MTYFLYYLLFINLAAVLAVLWDKLVAVKGWNNLPRKGIFWINRVPEKNLFIIALLGGSVGEYLAMRLIRQKNTTPESARFWGIAVSSRLANHPGWRRRASLRSRQTRGFPVGTSSAPGIWMKKARRRAGQTWMV